jgi:hypothetical protein
MVDGDLSGFATYQDDLPGNPTFQKRPSDRY